MSSKRNLKNHLNQQVAMVMFGRSRKKFNNKIKTQNRYSLMNQSIKRLTTEKSDQDCDFSQINKQKLYNRHIGRFRDSVPNNNQTLLPFLSSLRSPSLKIKSSEVVQPFDVAYKQTFNQKTKKKIRDFEGPSRRFYDSSYRWEHNKGINSKQTIQFESSLRMTTSQSNPQQKFNNSIKPIQYKNYETKIYKEQQLICPKQFKLFMQN